MHDLLAAALFFGILTLWAPGYWAIAVFEGGMFGLAVILGPASVVDWADSPPYETRIAIARWITLLAVFIAGLVLFQDARVHRWEKSCCRWRSTDPFVTGATRCSTPAWRQ
jgi:hypothetical protein